MFLDLLKDIAAEEGLTLSDPNHKALAIVRANQAAKELYDSNDLKDSLREGVFDINQGESQVALPWFVDQVRGMRYYDNRMPVTPEYLSNRYGGGIGNEIWYLKWREKENSVLQRELANESIIKFVIPLPETKDIKITINGPTTNSAKWSEIVTLLKDTTEVSTVGNYKSPLISLSKDRLTDYDIYAYDVDENQVSVLPNCLYTSYFTIYQIYDYTPPPTTTSQFSAVEVLFKRKYVSMQQDTDEFICGSRFEKAIFWKYMEHRSKDAITALSYQTKAKQIILEIEANEKAGKRERINFIAGPWFKLPYHVPQNYWRRW